MTSAAEDRGNKVAVGAATAEQGEGSANRVAGGTTTAPPTNRAGRFVAGPFARRREKGASKGLPGWVANGAKWRGSNPATHRSTRDVLGGVVHREVRGCGHWATGGGGVATGLSDCPGTESCTDRAGSCVDWLCTWGKMKGAETGLGGSASSGLILGAATGQYTDPARMCAAGSFNGLGETCDAGSCKRVCTEAANMICLEVHIGAVHGVRVKMWRPRQERRSVQQR